MTHADVWESPNWKPRVKSSRIVHRDHSVTGSNLAVEVTVTVPFVALEAWGTQRWEVDASHAAPLHGYDRGWIDSARGVAEMNAMALAARIQAENPDYMAEPRY